MAAEGDEEIVPPQRGRSFLQPTQACLHRGEASSSRRAPRRRTQTKDLDAASGALELAAKRGLSINRLPSPDDSHSGAATTPSYTQVDEATLDGQEKCPRFKTFQTQLRVRLNTQVCLKGVGLFQRCSPEFVEMLAEQVTTQIFSKGTDILRQGDSGECMYILNRGEVEIFVNTVQVATLGDGSVFGEMAAICRNPVAAKRTATVRAKTICDCRVIGRDALMQTLLRFRSDELIIEAEANRRIADLRAKGVLPSTQEWWRPCAATDGAATPKGDQQRKLWKLASNASCVSARLVMLSRRDRSRRTSANSTTEGDDEPIHHTMSAVDGEVGDPACSVYRRTLLALGSEEYDHVPAPSRSSSVREARARVLGRLFQHSCHGSRRSSGCSTGGPTVAPPTEQVSIGKLLVASGASSRRSSCTSCSSGCSGTASPMQSGARPGGLAPIGQVVTVLPPSHQPSPSLPPAPGSSCTSTPRPEAPSAVAPRGRPPSLSPAVGSPSRGPSAIGSPRGPSSGGSLSWGPSAVSSPVRGPSVVGSPARGVSPMPVLHLEAEPVVLPCCVSSEDTTDWTPVVSTLSPKSRLNEQRPHSSRPGSRHPACDTPLERAAARVARGRIVAHPWGDELQAATVDTARLMKPTAASRQRVVVTKNCQSDKSGHFDKVWLHTAADIVMQRRRSRPRR